MVERSSKKQQELLQFIDGFIKGNGYGPSYREVMRALGYKSVSTVAVHIDGLIARGYLRKRTHSARSLEVVTLRDSQAPVVASAGLLWLEQQIEHKENDSSITNRELETLIEAARLLGSQRSDEFAARLSVRTQPE